MAAAARVEFSPILNGWQLAAGGGDKLAGNGGFVLVATSNEMSATFSPLSRRYSLTGD